MLFIFTSLQLINLVTPTNVQQKITTDDENNQKYVNFTNKMLKVSLKLICCLRI